MSHDKRKSARQTRDVTNARGSKSGASTPENAITTNTVPEGFTLSLALVDALPVILFALMSVALGQKLQSGLFVTGAIVTFLGGAGKVLWKLIIAVAHRNIPWLNRQMRLVMPVGFALMIAGAIAHRTNLVAVLTSLVRVPSVLFVCLWLLCMVAMGYFAGHRQQNDAHSNWVEQGVNTIGQAALLVAILLAS